FHLRFYSNLILNKKLPIVGIGKNRKPIFFFFPIAIGIIYTYTPFFFFVGSRQPTIRVIQTSVFIYFDYPNVLHAALVGGAAHHITSTMSGIDIPEFVDSVILVLIGSIPNTIHLCIVTHK